MMKRIYIVVFILFLLNSIKAQTEWAPIGTEWYYCAPDNAGNPLSDYEKYVSDRDTLIENKTCRIIESENFREIMYMEENKVYYRFKNEFKLIYDFQANIEDTITFDFKSYKPNSYDIDTTYPVECIVKQIDTITVNDIKLRQFQTSVIQREDLDFLIWNSAYVYTERIGHGHGFMEVLSIPSHDPMENLRCYSDNDISYITDWWADQNKDCNYREELSLHENDFIEEDLNIFPNPAKGLVTVILPKKKRTETFVVNAYDITGKKIYSSFLQNGQTIDLTLFPEGIYYICIGNNELIYKPYKIIKL